MVFHNEISANTYDGLSKQLTLMVKTIMAVMMVPLIIMGLQTQHAIYIVLPAMVLLTEQLITMVLQIRQLITMVLLTQHLISMVLLMQQLITLVLLKEHLMIMVLLTQ